MIIISINQSKRGCDEGGKCADDDENGGGGGGHYEVVVVEINTDILLDALSSTIN